MSTCENKNCYNKSSNLCVCGKKVCSECFNDELKMCNVCTFYYYQKKNREKRLLLEGASSLFKAVISSRGFYIL